MSLDIRTIIVMFALLALMFACLLALAGLHTRNMSGVRRWSLANISFALGLGLAFFYDTRTPGHDWAVVLGSTFMGTGIALQLSGIQGFKRKRTDWRLAALFVGMAFGQSLWFTVIHPEVSARSIANSLLFAVGYLASARALLIRTELHLRTAYWFTGLSFACLVAVMVARAAVIFSSAPGSYGLYAQVPLNPWSFFTALMLQLCVTFGFILMMNSRLIAEIQDLASVDALTGAFNRRRLEEEAVRLLARCERTGDTLAIMMLDVDHFKAVNDRHGHPAGDEVLRRLAGVAQTSLRKDDFFARYGGEEFCILLLSTTEREAHLLAERLRRSYEEMTVLFGGYALRSTVSIGVADSIDAGLGYASLIAAADRALYRAKKDGRNRVVSHSTVELQVEPFSAPAPQYEPG